MKRIMSGRQTVGRWGAWILVLAFWLLAPSLAFACTREERVEVRECVEIELHSSVEFNHPVRDLVVTVQFNLDGSGLSRQVEAFWDGGATYRARVALPVAGRWRWRVETASVESGLDGKQGALDVIEAGSPDVFQEHGWLRASDDGRYLSHADGTPFFWLSDTAWEMASGSTDSEVQPYVRDRIAKGFNGVFMVVNSHYYNYPRHIINQEGEWYLMSEDRSLPNPRYFDHLDRLITEMNEAGMVVSLVPLWGIFAEVHRERSHHETLYTSEEAYLHARYIGARYAGHNVVWIIGGDTSYETQEQKAFWTTFAHYLDAASGSEHLMTSHPGGYSGSFQWWSDPTPDWLDFHMYQAGHYSGVEYQFDAEGNHFRDGFGSWRGLGDYMWRGGLQGYHIQDPLPVLSAESNYEDLFGQFWNYTSDSTGATRTNAQDVRHAAYYGLVSGSTVGFAYGANGVWQWTRHLEDGGFWPRRTALDALQFEGAKQMGVMREFAEAEKWYRWMPRPDLVESADADNYVAAASREENLIVYIPEGTRRARFALPGGAAEAVRLAWMHAATGHTVTTSLTTGELVFEIVPPDSTDWLVVVSPIKNVSVPDPPQWEARLQYAGPNPSREQPRLAVESPKQGAIGIRVFDALGRLVYHSALVVSPGRTPFVLPLSNAGVYSVEIVFPNDWTVSDDARRLSVVVTG